MNHTVEGSAPGSDGTTLKHVVLAIAIAASVYAALCAGLEATARWAERHFDSYPYLAGEEPLRLMLPSVFADEGSGTLLMGPSAILEAALHEELQHEWGVRVRPATLSTGTMDDFYIFLTYLEQAYGAEALPKRIILGMTLRALANEPRTFGPNADSGKVSVTEQLISRYSPAFRVRGGELGSVLERKSVVESVWSWMRFHLTKQQPRYRMALLAVIEHTLDPDPAKIGFQRGMIRFPDNIRTPLAPGNPQAFASLMRDSGILVTAMKWMRAYRSPYHHMFTPPAPTEKILSEISSIYKAYTWDPRSEMEMIDAQTGRLKEFLETHHIELLIVNMPGHPLFRAKYQQENIDAYKQILAEKFAGTPILDLWDRIPPELFYDDIHLNYEGARTVTRLLIDFVEESQR